MVDWKKELKQAFAAKEETQARIGGLRAENEAALAKRKQDVARFFRAVVSPAFEEIKAELKQYGKEVTSRCADAEAEIQVVRGNTLEIAYGPTVSVDSPSDRVWVTRKYMDSTEEDYCEGHHYLQIGGDECGIQRVTQELICQDFLECYKGVI